ncbi:hypothetical protein NCAS_0C01800 [Naumovozyma castellii]|uniref:Peroxisomal membrane protein PEX25 n=1 Tax=Naumovozyma castellii TaxID=27288 RepID=G0VCG0_NAUCA|nr:hypothetical protein NCAS_0C01800 [Naumovozyma castellii CBS 4309]CCC69170.1 hypothetical protein NCAS_0C01800 [Naumovozyma castellii CBS 4309]
MSLDEPASIDISMDPTTLKNNFLPSSMGLTPRDKNESEMTLVSPTPVSGIKQDETTERQLKIIKNIDILKYLINSLAGKDKFVKIIKCLLELFQQWVLNPARIAQDKNNLRALLLSNPLVWKNLLIHPVKFVRVMTLAVLTNISSNVAFSTAHLSTFRYMLRFGSSPFKMYQLYEKLKSTNRKNYQQVWFNEESLQETLDLYYTIFDEIDLLFKLKLISSKRNPKFYNFVTRNETISWQYDIILSWKQNWVQLQSLQREIIQLQVQLKIKSNSLNLSTQYHNNESEIGKQLLNDLQINEKWSLLKRETNAKLQELNEKKQIVYLDLTRLTFDLLANSTDLFNIKTPRGTYTALSLCSGAVGMIKLWKNARKTLST